MSVTQCRIHNSEINRPGCSIYIYMYVCMYVYMHNLWKWGKLIIVKSMGEIITVWQLCSHKLSQSHWWNKPIERAWITFMPVWCSQQLSFQFKFKLELQ